MNEVVKDSGSTQEFKTGAHRDNPVGKGRCDLLPLKYVCMAMNNDPVIGNIYMFMETRKIEFLADAIKVSVQTVNLFQIENIRDFLMENSIALPSEYFSDTEKNKEAIVNACLAHMMLEVSKLYEAGAIKYGENNWQLGMPVDRYIDSGVRHYLKTLRGDLDEPHYRGFVWNLLGAMWTAENYPEMNFKNIPKK